MGMAHRVYAEALLAAAKEEGSLDRVREEFDDFAAAFEDSPELRGFLRNPQIDRTAKQQALEDLLEGADERFLNFLRLLVEKGRIGEIDAVRTEWERLLAREERVLELELTTAVELSEEEAGEIVREIEKATGRRIEASRRVDPDLIGGLVLQAGSVRLDGSIRGRLAQLREELITRG
jgi:F-type H+-transporting ATPase subunit delta